MQAVLSQEDIFNQNFSTYGKKADINNLLDFALKNEYLSLQRVEDIYSVYKKSIIDNVLMELSYDEEDDVNLLIEEMTTFCYDSLNDYLMSMHNPYNAIKCILDVEPSKLIVDAKKRYKEHQQETNKKLLLLIKKSQPIMECNDGFKSLIDYIRQRIVNTKASCSYYTLMKYKDSASINCLDDLDSFIDSASIEVDIINRFNMSEVVRMLKSFTIVDIARNITETALYNYVYNSFYKDGSSIEFTSNMCDIVARDIKLGFYATSDVVEIITTGEVKFSENEEKYILEYFVDAFKREVIDSAHVDSFKKTVKSS